MNLLQLRKMLGHHRLLNAAGGETGSPSGTGDAGATGGAGGETPAPGKTADEPPSDEKKSSDVPAGGTQPPSDEKKADAKPSDAEAALLRDVMKHKGRANQLQGDLEALRKQYEGIDPEKYRAYVEAQAEAERKQLESRGEYDRLLAQMGERHTSVVQEYDGKLASATQTITSLENQISELTVGNAFATTPVIGEELLMTRAKARAVYGAHFDFVDGKVVAYDKPRGASERTQLVTAQGEPMDFNTALMHLVNNDPDPERDRLLRSKAKPGAGSATATGGAATRAVAAGQRQVAMTPAERIAAGLRLAQQK